MNEAEVEIKFIPAAGCGSIWYGLPSNQVKAMNTIDLPAKIQVASPCHARWEDMRGDECARFCSHCQKNVYNLSALTKQEAAALIQSKEGRLCIRFYQRADGTLLTTDYPIGLGQAWKRVRKLLAAGAALIIFTMINLAALGRGENQSQPRSRFLKDMESARVLIQDKLGLNPRPPMLGKMLALPKPNPPSIPPKQNQSPSTPSSL
jgi:hypothetical protein